MGLWSGNRVEIIGLGLWSIQERVWGVGIGLWSGNWGWGMGIR
jgi:hypothetical protein